MYKFEFMYSIDINNFMNCNHFVRHNQNKYIKFLLLFKFIYKDHKYLHLDYFIIHTI